MRLLAKSSILRLALTTTLVSIVLLGVAQLMSVANAHGNSTHGSVTEFKSTVSRSNQGLLTGALRAHPPLPYSGRQGGAGTHTKFALPNANASATFLEAPSYPSGGENAYSVAVADVNGVGHPDGHPDLLVANYCADSNCLTGSVSVLLGNGDGTFQTAVSYSSGGYHAVSVAVADVNGDGHPDLLVANECVTSSNCSNGGVGVLLGNGDGTFQTAVSYSSGGQYATSVAVADVNGDGYLDLLVANECSLITCSNGEVGVLLGNGDGTFQSPVSYNSGGQYAYSIAVGKVDGNSSLVVANYCVSSSNCSNGSVGVLLGNGTGTFQAAVSYNSGDQNAYSIAVADVNDDGLPDVLVANVCASGSSCSNGSVGVLLGIAGGTFQGAITYNSGDQTAYSTAVADLNGDGKPDLIVANECAISTSCANGSLSVLLGNGDGTFQTATSYSSGGYHATSVAVANVAGASNPPALLVANQCASSSNCSNGTISVLLGNGNGTFQAPVSYNSGGEYAYSIAVEDVNGDGNPDLLVANQCQTYGSCGNGGGVSVLLGNGDGTFQTAVSYNSGGYEAYSIAVGNLNGNPSGPLDLVVANSCASFSDCENGGGVSVLMGNGDGTFQPAVSYSSGGYQAVAVAVADVNGDGTPDLLVANQCVSSSDCNNGGIGVLLGIGDGTFQPAVFTSTPELSMGQIAVADFNGDGFLDAAIGSGTILLLGNGDGTFQTPLSLGASGNDIAVGDFNNDGRPDLAVGGVTILLNILPAVTSSVNPVGVGQSVTFTATISSGRGNSPKGTVTFFDSGSEIGTGSIASGHAQFTTSSLGTGSHSITAAYAGDGRYQPSPSAPLNEVVTSKLVATRTKVTTSGSPSRIHQSVTFTATVSSAHGSIPNGETVTFFDGTESIGTGTTAGGVAALTTSSLSAKTHTIKATYAGDHTFKTSSGTVKQVVERYPSTTTLTSNPNPSTSGESVTLTATVSSGAPGGATGTVAFKNGSTTLGKATLSSGTATISTTKLPVGTLTITADYSGDAESTESSGSVKQVVNN